MKKTDHALLKEQLCALSDGVSCGMTVLANASALLWQSMDALNWAGFYLMRGGKLVLGPFQGKTACTEIAVGRGVCGTAVRTAQTQRVEDVHLFPGHIACDCASNSEIVVPIRCGDTVIGVLDIDSPVLSRFSEEDQTGLEEFVRTLEPILAALPMF